MSELGLDIDNRAPGSRLALLLLHFPRLRLVWSRRWVGVRACVWKGGVRMCGRAGGYLCVCVNVGMCVCVNVGMGAAHVGVWEGGWCAFKRGKGKGVWTSVWGVL